jgi:hypothetical protein
MPHPLSMTQSPRSWIALRFTHLVSGPASKLDHASHDRVSPLQPVTHALGETQVDNRHPDITRHIREGAYRL